MSWRRWKLGFFIACLTGFFGALITLGVVKDIGGWQGFLILLAVGIGKDALLFLKAHPVENLKTDTDLIRAERVKAEVERDDH